jgi:MFS family permease
MTVLGNAGSLALAAVLVGNTTQRTLGSVVPFGAAVYYVATGVLLALTTLITLLRVHETPLAARVEGAGPDAPGFGERLTALWLEPWRHRDFTWVFLTRCAVMLGLSLYLTFIEYYFANVAGISNFAAETAVLSLLALLGASLSAFTLGLLSDRIGRVVVVCVSTVLMALASVAFVVLPAGVPLWPLGLVFGLGYGAYTSVDWALAVDVLPSREAAGKDMGLWSIASSLPSILAPVLGGAVIAATGFSGNTALGYRAVFALAVVFLLAGAVFILIVRDQVPGAIGKPRVRRPRRRPRVRLGWRLALGAGGGRARGFLRFWPVWERVTWLAHRPQPIPGAPYGVFLIVRRRHSGRPIELPDGTRVARGDMILELHANNQLLATAAETASPWELVRMMMGDLRALAAWAQTPAFPADVRAIFGVTLMGRAAGRLGFTLRERPRTLHARLERFFMMGLLVLYNPRGRRRLAQGMTYSTYPMEVWMSRGALLARYGGATRAE